MTDGTNADQPAGKTVAVRTVFAFPGRLNRLVNPYNLVLYDQLETLGWRVVDPNIVQALTQRADIVHVHWPQDRVNQTFWLTVRRSLSFLAIIIMQRLRGAQFVWTVHNVVSHQPKRPHLERLYMAIVTRLLSGYIVLNQATRAEAIMQYPRLETVKWAMVPHAIYGDAYPPSPPKAMARQHFGLANDDPVVAFVGDLREYKGLERFLRNLLAAAPGTFTCFVAGRFSDPAFAQRIRDIVTDAQRRGFAIVLREGWLTEADLVAALAACDLLALPYTNDSNSGFAVLAAERGVPLLLSGSSAFQELCKDIDSDTTMIAGEDFSGGEVVRALERARAGGPSTASPAFLAMRAPLQTARLTDAFFRELTHG